ncbi:MAG TPA: type II secretion system minor pseudopilin GspK [Lysobacter sp.]|nr:type II secretion system minor pseudopilin GspK [Lysobacter sp.]
MSAHRPMRGAALLLVLWLIVLLTALIGAFALTARIELLQGRVLARGLVGDAAARAGLEYALVRVDETDPRRRWLPDGRPYRWQYHDARVEVRITDENGRVDLNYADHALLTALLRALGVEATEAARLAGALVDWRDPDPLTQPAGGAEDGDYSAAGLPYGAKDAEFESTGELLQVLGFTPQLVARLEPHVTVYSGRERPDPAFATAPVLDALGLDGDAVVAQRQRWDPASGAPPPLLAGGASAGGERSGAYSIESRARLPDGRESRLRAVVRSGGGALPGMTYTPLRWEEGASAR